jgi:hypothetical protein
LVGVLAAGLLFGEILARIDQIYVALRRRMELSRVNSLMLYPFVFLYILVVYQLYLSGSGVVADGVLSTLILGIMYSVGRHRSIAPAGASSPSSLTKLRPGW